MIGCRLKMRMNSHNHAETPFVLSWQGCCNRGMTVMQTNPQSRTKSGQFAPGQSGNPGGRPGDEHRVADLARGYIIEAIETLAE